jgi:hypothetical protein
VRDTRQRKPWRRPRYQMAAVAALGAAMVAATLIVGLGADDRKEPRTTVSDDARPTGTVTPSPAPPAAPRSVAPPRMPVDTRRQSAAKVIVSTSGSIEKNRRTLKVVSARSDLTGQRELAWIADAGHAVGDAWCTRNLRRSAQSEAGDQPTMLLCWRTSTTKSVYTLAIDIDKRPSEMASVAKLNATWNAMS